MTAATARRAVVAVVGRPNVGKSTLVNRIVGRRTAIVQEKPGVTRDRKELDAQWNGRSFLVVDTGGWLPEGMNTEDPSALTRQVSAQAERAIREADLVLLVVDTTVGAVEEDSRVARILQRADKPILVAANKVDDQRQEADAWAFANLGLGDVFPISAAHGRGTGDLLDAVVAGLPPEAEEAATPADASFAVAIVGRPNVGKSTLFNRLTRSRDAIVFDYPGLTRDRHYGHGRGGTKPYLVIDTGGFEPETKSGIMAAMARQTRQAIDEADIVLFLVDGREGVTSQDREIAGLIRRNAQRHLLVVNKTEGMARERVAADFFELGLGEPLPISSAHGDNVGELIELALEPFPEPPDDDETSRDPAGTIRPRIAIVGRPNVGKSTLVNTLLGEERVIAFDEPGTTRDSIYLDFERGGHPYTLIDTAGVRRRGKVTDAVEKFSVIKTLQAIDDANVAVLLVDARQEISDQDAHIAGFILEAGRALVVAINKWDRLAAEERENIRREFDRKLGFLGFARHHYISALEGTGVNELFNSVREAYAAATTKLPTPRLTRALQAAVQRQQPPRDGAGRP
jgi:GTP-binding protein